MIDPFALYAFSGDGFGVPALGDHLFVFDPFPAQDHGVAVRHPVEGMVLDLVFGEHPLVAPDHLPAPVNLFDVPANAVDAAV